MKSKAASEQHISKALTSHISPFPQSLTTGLHLQRPQSLTPSTAIKLQQTTQHDRRREEEKTMQHDSRRDDAAEIAPVAAVAVAVEIDQPLAHRCLPSPLSHRCLPPPQQAAANLLPSQHLPAMYWNEDAPTCSDSSPLTKKFLADDSH
nr:NAC transcription factor 56-like [Ipomoea batatas]